MTIGCAAVVVDSATPPARPISVHRPVQKPVQKIVRGRSRGVCVC